MLRSEKSDTNVQKTLVQATYHWKLFIQEFALKFKIEFMLDYWHKNCLKIVLYGILYFCGPFENDDNIVFGHFSSALWRLSQQMFGK